MSWKEFLKAEADDVYRSAAGLIDLCESAVLDWKPQSGSNWLTVGQLLLHITNACGSIARGFDTGVWDMTGQGLDPNHKPAEGEFMPPAEAHLGVESLDEARERLAADKATFLKVIEGISEERLQNERSVAPWGGAESPLGAHMASCVYHLETHKSQLFYYLKLQGKPVNTKHLWGMA